MQYFDNLTKRENEVLPYLVSGLSNKGVARKLNLSPRTIEDHRASVRFKLNVGSDVELVLRVYNIPKEIP